MRDLFALPLYASFRTFGDARIESRAETESSEIINGSMRLFRTVFHRVTLWRSLSIRSANGSIE
jgi:hypothetical protein